MEIKSIYLNQLHYAFKTNSKVDILSKESPCSLILCKSEDPLGVHWLPTILQRQHKIYQIFFQKMACKLSLQCIFLYGFFHCDLPEGTVDVGITGQTLKGIHTFRKDHNAQSSVCSPWGSHIKPFLLLRRQMVAYIKERQTITNPFNRSFPNRPNTSPFA